MSAGGEMTQTDLSRPALTIHHFGDDPVYVGGIGSVIRVLTEHQIGGDAAISHPTWRPNSRSGSALLALSAAADIARMGRSDVAHFHLAERGSFLREGALLVLARLRGLVTVATIHGSSFLPFARRYPWLVSRVLRRAHVVTCLDRDVLDFVRQSAPQVRAELVPNPVAIDDASPAADETEELVVFAGEICLRKGADVLCRAWRRVAETRPQARCIMVGPARDFLVPRTERLEVRPPVDAETVRGLLRSARVVALPSRAEGMPMVLTEAMSAGRPFVSTPVGGIPDLARAGGVLVPVGDDVRFATSLIGFLADPRFARAVGERGRQLCEETRSVHVVDALLRELYSTSHKRG